MEAEGRVSMARRAQKGVLFLGIGATSAEAAFNAVAARMGLSWKASSRELSAGELSDAPERVVVIVQPELHAEWKERFAALSEKAEYWPTGTEAQIEDEVNGLVARILGGGQRQESGPAPQASAPQEPPRKQLTAKVGRETAGRRGKGVVTVFDLSISEGEMQKLAAVLKQRCGTGGTVKDGRIEIQGDQRERVVAELEKLGYTVKRVGG
jgi:predicted translation initiation factor SUI1